MKQEPLVPQARFLAMDHIPEVLYGGAAGGGKSSALLLAALRYVDVPGYSAILFRKTYADLALPGALMDRAAEWLTDSPAKWDSKSKTWSFPSGATMTFGYLDNKDDHFRYQGAEFQMIGFDELTQFPENQYRYLFSRLRRLATAAVPVRMRAASNPGGLGHEWVKKRFLLETSADRLFVPARLADNPRLDQANYVASLMQLDPITRQQLLDGDWDAYQGGRFLRHWLKYYDRHGDGYLLGDRIYPKEQIHDRFLTVDPAASEKLTADYTVISAWAVTPRQELLWLDCYRAHMEVPDIVPKIFELAKRHQAGFVAIEDVAFQAGIIQEARRRKGMPEVVAMKRVRGGGKLVRATVAINRVQSGRVWLPMSAPWLEEVESELLRFTGNEDLDANDDIVDTLSDAAELLAREQDNQQSDFRPYVLQT